MAVRKYDKTRPVSAAERRAWALERVLEAARSVAKDRRDPSLVTALVSRLAEHDALAAAAAQEEHASAISEREHIRRQRFLEKHYRSERQ